MNMQQIIRKSVFELTPSFPTIADVPVSDIQQMVGVKVISKLSANENPLGPSPKAVKAMNEALLGMNRYPDSMARALRGTIGKNFNLDPRHVILSSGLEGGLHMLTEAVLEAGDEVIIPEHSPSLYTRVVQMAGASVITAATPDGGLSFAQLQDMITPSTKLILLGNPADPTGSIFSVQYLREFLSKLPHKNIIVAIDESYGDFASTDEYQSAAELVPEFPNLVILRSFSAFYSLAAARIGYLVTSLDVGGYLNRIRLPFQISSVSQAGALASLHDREHQLQTKEVIDQGKAYLYALFEELGLSYVPSHANFVLADTGHDANQVFNALARRGVIVRVIGSLPTQIRVSIGNTEELQLFADALRDVLTHCGASK